MKYVAVTLPGLEGLVATEAMSKGILVHGIPCRARVVLEGKLEDILRLRSIEAVYKLLATLRISRGRNWRNRFRRELRVLLKRIEPPKVKAGCAFVHVVCFQCGLPWVKVREYAKIAARELQRVYNLEPKPRPHTDKGTCLILRLELCNDDILVGFEIARSLHRRWYLQESIPALLNPLAAYATVVYANIYKANLIIDWFAGGATLAIEGLQEKPSYAVGIEIDGNVAKKALRHARNAYVDAMLDIVVSDAFKPPLRAGLKAICVADPPRGGRVRGKFNPSMFKDYCRWATFILPKKHAANLNGETVCNVLTGWGWLSIKTLMFEETNL